MRVDIETITPEMASKYLEHNTINRNINIKRVQAYAYDMKHGAWQLNGEAIRFDKSGNLKDGQHRLAAIVKSKVPINMVVMRDIDDDISIYDRGRPRSISDEFTVSGMDKELSNNTNVAIAKLHYNIQGSNRLVSDLQVRNFIEQHADTLRKLRPLLVRHHEKGMARMSTKNASFLLAALYALECGEDLEDIKQFASAFRTGLVEDKNQSAAIVCRNDVLAGNLTPGGGTEKRIKATYIFEKGIYDFCRRYPRKVTYKGCEEPTYSNNQKFRSSVEQ